MFIQFFNRKPNHFFFSIEELFETLQRFFPEKVRYHNYEMPYESKGFFKRIKNVWFSVKHAKEINHITGDVHYLGIFLSRKKTILTIHDCGELDNQKGVKKFILWLFWFYLPVKHLKYITVISESTKSHLLRYVKVNENKITVIPNCLIGDYKTSLKPFNKSYPQILLVGTTPNKNIERVAIALRDLCCSVFIIGEPNDLQLKALSENNIRFSFRKGMTRTEVIQAYADCDVVMFVSLIEGFGLPIIEAQASGKPVITSNISAMPATAGADGCFVDPYNISDIRNALIKVINNDDYRNLLISKGIDNSKQFNPKVISDKYLALYEKVKFEN